MFCPELSTMSGFPGKNFNGARNVRSSLSGSDKEAGFAFLTRLMIRERDRDDAVTLSRLPLWELRMDDVADHVLFRPRGLQYPVDFQDIPVLSVDGHDDVPQAQIRGDVPERKLAEVFHAAGLDDLLRGFREAHGPEVDLIRGVSPLRLPGVDRINLEAIEPRVDFRVIARGYVPGPVFEKLVW